MAHPLASPDAKYTYADLSSWPDDERWELIEGKAYAMTTPNRWHSLVSTNLARILTNHFHGSPCEVHIGNFGIRLPKGQEKDEEVDTVVIPDLVVVCDQSKLDERGCRGAPELIVEILSPSTAAHDQLRKLNLYEKHGVKEYWIISPDGILMSFTLKSGKRYGRPDILDRTMKLKSRQFPGLGVDLDQVFPPEPPKVVRQSPASYVASPAAQKSHRKRT
ncbi:MAG TPA: Uma2 family endonuclease [Candidatus Ozemobacteraceae bacterium]|nr:Uma2 family endonuclease [Candidatus Ozemobacteraceae bacterium]